MRTLSLAIASVIAFLLSSCATVTVDGKRDSMEAMMFFEMAGGIKPIHKAVLQGSKKELIGILQSKSDVNARTNSDATALHISAWFGDLEMTRMLLKAGAEVNAVEGRGFTPLAVSACHNAKDVAQLLIKAGAFVNPSSKVSNSPLYWAVCFGDSQFVEIILKAGAEVNIQDKDTGVTPLYGAVKNALHPKEIVTMLLSAGAEPNVVDNKGQTLLHICSDRDVAAILLENGVNIATVDGQGDTSLHTASLLNHTKMVEYLLGKGVDPNAKNMRGDSPLHLVVRYFRRESPSIAKLLIEAGANINTKNHEGKTPLDEAKETQKQELLKILIQ